MDGILGKLAASISFAARRAAVGPCGAFIGAAGWQPCTIPSELAPDGPVRALAIRLERSPDDCPWPPMMARANPIDELSADDAPGESIAAENGQRYYAALPSLALSAATRVATADNLSKLRCWSLFSEDPLVYDTPSVVRILLLQTLFFTSLTTRCLSQAWPRGTTLRRI